LVFLINRIPFKTGSFIHIKRKHNLIASCNVFFLAEV
jgi:hypothetical protein